jgi:hypothetical protein
MNDDFESEGAAEHRWNDLLAGNRFEFSVRGRAMRAAHRALILRSSGRYVNENAANLQRYDLLNAPRDAWRRQRARMRRLSIEKPKAALCITVTSWIVSFLVCVFVVFLLTRDFIQDSRSALFASRLEYRSELMLPPMTLCYSAVDSPAFPLFGRGPESPWRGEPLFNVPSLLRRTGSWDFEKDPNYELDPSYLGSEDGRCVDKLSMLDAHSLRLQEGGDFAYGTDRKHCKACFRIGGRNRLPLRDPAGSSGSPSSYRVQVESSATAVGCSEYPNVRLAPLACALPFTSGAFNSVLIVALLTYALEVWFCFVVSTFQAGFMYTPTVLELLSRLYEAGDELQQKGILDWGDLDFSNRTLFDSVLPLPKWNPDGNATSAYEVCCHVYLFSGIWYPQKPDSDIRYRYDASVAGFVRSGAGPYLTEHPFKISDIGNRAAEYSRASRNLSEIKVDLTSYALEIYIDSESADDEGDNRVVHNTEKGVFGTSHLVRVPDSATLFTLFQRNTHALLAFTRHETDGKVRYDTKTSSVPLSSMRAPSEVDAWLIEIVMDTFDVRVNEKIRPSRSRYISDVMGIIFFALGLSVYSVIVGPTNILFFGLTLQKSQRASASEKDSSAAGLSQDGADNTCVPADTEGISLDYGIRRRQAVQ